jgi:DNA polymerase
MFVGEAPGRTEAKLRRPFAGASGKMLDELLVSVGILRTDIFITNAVKYRPTDERGNNRPPNPAELLASIPYLRREHGLLGRPPIVMLGKHARQTVEHGYQLPEGLVIGQWFWMKADGGFPVLPLYHPAYGIYQRSNRPIMFEQFRAVLTPPASAEEADAAQ